ncbi:MAG: hypothetical protein J0L92_12675 [Deltaproteobacteria bacterium]|nr:hypothetical protein [Deltaproteobacteria bacterium]
MAPRPNQSLRRATLLAIIFGAIGVACDSAAASGGVAVCSFCGVIGNAVVESETEQWNARNSCGTCPDGTRCNPLHQPSRCTPDPGGEGERCGMAFGAFYTCERGRQCADGVCRELPGVGAPCDFDAQEVGLSLAHLTSSYCGPGLVCGTDERCRAGCATDCTTPQVCNPLVDPPRCTADFALPGEPCGRVHRRWTRGCVPLHACVDRGAGATCELTDALGPECDEDERCPTGATCMTERAVCVFADR